MVTIRCEGITVEIFNAACMIANNQQETVRIIAPTETLEVVNNEEVSEMQTEEGKEAQQQQEVQEEP